MESYYVDLTRDYGFTIGCSGKTYKKKLGAQYWTKIGPKSGFSLFSQVWFISLNLLLCLQVLIISVILFKRLPSF